MAAIKMNSSADEKSIHFDGLDILRGAAILMVMAAHFLPALFENLNCRPVWSLGGAGVLLFFYLSGFLIFRNVQKQPSGIFLLRRFFKLFPAYWVNIAIIFLAAGIFHAGEMTDPKTLLSNIFLVQEFTHSNLLNGVYWTLQIEVKFYIVIALFVYCFGSRKIYWLLGVLLLVNMALLPGMGRGSTLLTYLSAFFPGIAAARASARGWDRKGVFELTLVTALVAINLLLGLEQGNGYQAAYSVLFSAAIAAALVFPIRSAFFAFFGKISYSDYLYHSIVGYALITWLASYTWLSKSLILTASFLASVAAAMLSFHLIEKPGVALGHRLEKSLPSWRFLHRVVPRVERTSE